MTITQKIIRNQKSFYTELLGRYDIYSQSAVAWFDGGQEIRFRELIKIIPDKISPYSLLDVGCGLGDMYGYLSANGYSNIDYTGIDALQEMVETGKRKYPGLKTYKSEFLSDSFNGNFDFLTSSGAMNIKMFRSVERQQQYVLDFIEKLYGLSLTACSFNLLCTRESRHFRDDENIYYADRNLIYAACRELCREVELVYKSEIFGFTVFMRKHGRK